MRKGGFTAAALAPLVLAPATLRAQTDEYEVGAVFTAIGAEQLERSAKGVGARFSLTTPTSISRWTPKRP